MVIVVMALVLAACGTRLPNSAFVKSQSTSNANGTSAGDQGGDVTDGSGTAGTAGSDATAGATGAGGGAASGGTAGKAGSSATAGGGGPGGPNTASDVGVTPTSIKLGNITAIQGQFGPDAFSPSLYGLQSFVNSLNARGGINGRKIDLKTCDDRDTGDGNLACAQQLVDQQKIFAFLANNTQSSARSANYTFTKGVPDLGLPLNNGYQKYPTMYSFYGANGHPRNGKEVGYQGKLWQPTGLYRWYKLQRGVDKGAFFYYTIAVSQQQGFAEINNATAEGIKKAYVGGGSDQGENFAAPSFDTDVVNMRQAGVNGIWDAMDIGANQKLCKAMDRGPFTVKAKVSTIEVWGQAVGTDYSAPCRNSVYASGASEPYSDRGNPLVSQFLGDFGKYQPGRKMHQWALEGWAMGLLFQKGASTMGANLTRAGWMKWLNGLKDYTLDGLMNPFDYQRQDYNAPKHDCFSIAHWQDQAGTFVTEAPITTCYEAKWVGSTFADDGA
ncbi:MAG: amino acid/amide transporter substrate-binding protein family [Acidimicrobiales bacterium]|nr:amino acid/amide transporter substrate-binding protein family [Acidimicrobiales bacterium]